MRRAPLFGPRARRVYYMLGTIAALLAIVGLAIWALVAASAGRPLQAVVAAALIACSVGFVALAHRRTNALIEQAEEEDRAAGRADFERWARAGHGAFVAHIRPLVYLALLPFACGLASLTFLAIKDAAWVLAALCGVFTFPFAALLLLYLRNREAFVIDSRGVDDRIYFGHIPWNEIRGAVLWSHEMRGLRVELFLEVPDVRPYLARQGFIARIMSWGMTSGGTTLRLPVKMLDQPPHAVFAALRQFHERAVPRGSMLGDGDSYRVEPMWARASELDNQAFAMMEQINRDAQDARIASDPKRQAAFKRDLEAKLAEIERLNAESTKLSEASFRDIERRMARGRVEARRARVALVVFGTIAVVWLVLRIFGIVP